MTSCSPKIVPHVPRAPLDTPCHSGLFGGERGRSIRLLMVYQDIIPSLVMGTADQGVSTGSSGGLRSRMCSAATPFLFCSRLSIAVLCRRTVSLTHGCEWHRTLYGMHCATGRSNRTSRRSFSRSAAVWASTACQNRFSHPRSPALPSLSLPSSSLHPLWPHPSSSSLALS